MKRFACEMCGGTELVKQDGLVVCQHCGMKYSPEEVKKMMIEGTVNVQGTVKVDNSAFVEKYIANARRAYVKEDWDEVEKYYNMVEQNAPDNMEAVFFSAFGKAMLALTDNDYFKREQKFAVLVRSISVINDYFETTSEDKESVLRKIADAIGKMYTTTYIYRPNQSSNNVGGDRWQIKLMHSVRDAFITELKQIGEKHDDAYIQELIAEMTPKEPEKIESETPGQCLAIVVLAAVIVCAFLYIMA
jgi:uncharacterized Zn finger protein (UPF0148 family)